MKNLRTIILAAGKGTRMKSATPKVLHTVAGKSLIRCILETARSAGSLKTCVVLGHQADKVRETLGKDVESVIQKTQNGTADAVSTALSFLQGYKGDVLILSGDTPLLRSETIKALIRRHRRLNAVCSFLTAVLHENEGYGRVIRGPNGSAVAIREESDATEYEKNIVEINVGVYCFKAEVLKAALKDVKVNPKKKEFYLTDIIEILGEQGAKIETVEAEDPKEALGINTREELAIAESVMRQRILKKLMADGVTVMDPNTTFVHADVKIGQDTILYPFTVIEADVRIGANCRIGPFAHLRPGTKVGNRVQLGNFVEVSRSKVGDDSLMKHFSFLGDASIGSGVNIGAGVVTANYDGTHKNKTSVSDHAFIGSDSVLVAPVRIGKKAVTGAGSVVTRGKVVPNGATVVGVPAKVVTNHKK